MAVSQTSNNLNIQPINFDLLEFGMFFAHDCFIGRVIAIVGGGSEWRALANSDRVGDKNLLLKYANQKTLTNAFSWDVQE